MITPIPFTIEDNSTLEPPMKRISRPAACIQSPYLRSFPSQGNVTPSDQTVNFQYKFCLESPNISDYAIFENWYGKGLRLGNKLRKFHKDELRLYPSIDLGPVHIVSKMWWYDLKQVGVPLNDGHIDAMFYFMRMRMKFSSPNDVRATSTDCLFDTKIRSIFDKFTKDVNAIDKHHALALYPTGKKLWFGSNWGEVDHVFIPIFMDKRAHWILADFDISKWHLDVYNSYFKTIRDVAVLAAVDPLRYILPHILSSIKQC
ncbi:Uncharacterized protein Adt_22430 [Abeliophyllum distichum]|uniref:Ubiquitin-like protease family profile domain-containing protein n=1 Tax=Abeliophyllum distichum TaxID=126358 RepID=A0ABD1T257_9LAMI